MQQQHVFFLQRMNDHVQYLNKIKLTLSNQGNFQGLDCHQCALGKWLYGEGRTQAKQLGEEVRKLFDQLIEPHAAFHEASARALNCHQRGDEVGKYRAMTDMHKLSTGLIQKLLDMDKYANQQRKLA